MSNRYFRLASIYFMLGIVLGIGMAATENFALRPVHAHVNLLGWVSLLLFGLFYRAMPDAARGKLAGVHFWLYNIALPVQMVALALLSLGNTAVVPVLGVASIALAVGVLCFVANLWRHTSGRTAAMQR